MKFWLPDPKRKIDASARQKMLWLFRIGYDSFQYLKVNGYLDALPENADPESIEEKSADFSFNTLAKYLRANGYSRTSRQLVTMVYRLVKAIESDPAKPTIEESQSDKQPWYTDYLETTENAGPPPPWLNAVMTRLWGRRLRDMYKKMADDDDSPQSYAYAISSLRALLLHLSKTAALFNSPIIPKPHTLLDIADDLDKFVRLSYANGDLGIDFLEVYAKTEKAENVMAEHETEGNFAKITYIYMWFNWPMLKYFSNFDEFYRGLIDMWGE